MDFMQAFLVSLAAIVAFIICVGLLVFVLAKFNVFFTIVEQGWCRIVLTWGMYSRTVGPGIHWIGIPGINTLYRRKMTFLKSRTNEKGEPQAELHEDKDISSFKTTDYPYAFPFKDEEDSHALPLSGFLVVIAVLKNYEKAFFTASDWYSIMNTEVMPCFRDVLVASSYDDDIVGRDKKGEKKKEAFSKRLFMALKGYKEDSSDPTGFKKMPGLSVVERLDQLYGIVIKSAELRSVDPPKGWRDITLAPYRAQREQAAAGHQAETSAILFDDTNLALEKWRKAHPKVTQAQIEAKQEELRQRALAKTPGYSQIHIKGLENATTAVVGGGAGGTGVLIGGGGQGDRKGNRRDGKDSGNQGGGRQGGQPDQKPYEDAAKDFFDKHGVYPPWDPLKRQPVGNGKNPTSK